MVSRDEQIKCTEKWLSPVLFGGIRTPIKYSLSVSLNCKDKRKILNNKAQHKTGFLQAVSTIWEVDGLITVWRDSQVSLYLIIPGKRNLSNDGTFGLDLKLYESKVQRQIRRHFSHSGLFLHLEVTFIAKCFLENFEEKLNQYLNDPHILSLPPYSDSPGLK